MEDCVDRVRSATFVTKLGLLEGYLQVAYTGTWSQHLKTLKKIFKRLKEANLTLILTKCEFGRATITYLGKQIGQGQVCPVHAKSQAIINYPVPTT